MTTIQERAICFDFGPGIAAEGYDKWEFTARRDEKKLDIVAVETPAALETTWLIEVKDYRVIFPQTPPKLANLSGLPETVAQKVQDSLVGLADAAVNAAHPGERQHAAWAVAAPKRRVVLHLEPHSGPHSALFPPTFTAPHVFQKLQQLVRSVDPRPLVLSIATTPRAGVPWSVS
jgi:hypothetical protein